MPKYNLQKIRFATDAPTYQKALGLYESGKVCNFEFDGVAYSATVIGSSPYQVRVSGKQYDQGSCNCYLGQNNTLCKHMVAVAICAAAGGKPLGKEDRQPAGEPFCSGELGTLTAANLAAANKSITACLRYIKPYEGPSRIWFAYQNSLDEGCARLSEVISKLPISKQSSDLLVDLLLRLDKKLSSAGVDDSNGTVGGFMEATVKVLLDFVKLDKNCVLSFDILKNRETCFGWEEQLLKSY